MTPHGRTWRDLPRAERRTGRDLLVDAAFLLFPVAVFVLFLYLGTTFL